MRSVAVLFIAVVLAGCGSFSDPTEEEGVLTIRNELAEAASVGYCDTAACRTFAWNDRLSAGGSSKDSINAAKGTSAWFLVRSAGQVIGCQRLSFPRGPFGQLTLVVARTSLRPCQQQ